MRARNGVIYGALFIAVIAISVITATYTNDRLLNAISILSTLAGVVGLLYSFHLDRNISEATFIFELSTSFRTNEKIQTLGQKLEKAFRSEPVSITKDDRPLMTEYLVFFEMLASMEERGVISISSFDALFGYDFFIAINNKDVREIEYLMYIEYYSMTAILEKKWRKYRKKKCLPIPYE